MVFYPGRLIALVVGALVWGAIIVLTHMNPVVAIVAGALIGFGWGFALPFVGPDAS